MKTKDWYGVRSIYCTDLVEDGRKFRNFEERVVLIRASNPKVALRKAEKEAKEYARRFSPTVLLKYQMAYVIHGDKQLREGDEVWSCITRTDDKADPSAKYLMRKYGNEVDSLTNTSRMISKRKR